MPILFTLLGVYCFLMTFGAILGDDARKAFLFAIGTIASFVLAFYTLLLL